MSYCLFCHKFRCHGNHCLYTGRPYKLTLVDCLPDNEIEDRPVCSCTAASDSYWWRLSLMSDRCTLDMTAVRARTRLHTYIHRPL